MTPDKSITRIVKLHFKPENVESFIEIFKKHKEDMASHTECLELNGYQDSQFPEILFTISRWTSQEALDRYRYSEYFRELWGRVKPLFDEKAEAHSIIKVY